MSTAFTRKEAVSKRMAVTSRFERTVAASMKQALKPRRRVPLFIPASQVYYWSSQWQRDEAESLANLRAGRSKTFDKPTDALRYLLDD